jgi:hypothetical protein
MAGSYPAPLIKNCNLKAELLRKITEVHNRLSELYQREVQAMEQGNRAADAMVAAEIEIEQMRRARLLIEFQDHVEEHGC